MQAAVAMLEALKEDRDKVLPVKMKTHQTQKQPKANNIIFYRKQRQTPITLTKPLRQHSNLCKSMIVEEELLVCSACFQEKGSNHANVEVSWIQCDTCSKLTYSHVTSVSRKHLLTLIGCYNHTYVTINVKMVPLMRNYHIYTTAKNVF